MQARSPISLSLCGDVMTGRGIDQVLRTPGNPGLFEPVVRDAREYVRLAEEVSGPIHRPVSDAYVWGNSLDELKAADPDLRVVNLETSITRSDQAWPGKGIHYRMHPGNIGCLKVARIDCACLANNHVLDWGRQGLLETLQSLDAAGIAHAGAGRTDLEAAAPAVLKLRTGGRAIVASYGHTGSGIPAGWAATSTRPGVRLLADLSGRTADRTAAELEQVACPGDVRIASLHWGGNWGYTVPPDHARFARRLVDAGVDLVHGHSSHHVMPLEIYRGRLILYGCGDFINDYEGIPGYEEYRSDLRVMFLIHLEPGSGRLARAALVPFQARRFRLHHASRSDREWLRKRLDELCRPLGVRIEPDGERRLVVRWG